jgi:hypothetical protein
MLRFLISVDTYTLSKLIFSVLPTDGGHRACEDGKPLLIASFALVYLVIQTRVSRGEQGAFSIFKNQGASGDRGTVDGVT